MVKLIKQAAGVTLMGAAIIGVGANLPLPIGPSAQAAPKENIQDAHGKSHQPLSASGQKATVLFFVMAECPIANTFAPEINRIVADYAARGIRSYLIYAEDDLPPKAARQHAQDHQFKMPVLLDRDHVLAKFVHATVSPEVAVLAPDNRVLYRGRIDDRAAAFGKRRVQPAKRDLREALDAVLDGKPVPTRFTRAVGCYLTINENSKSHEN